MNTQNPVSKKLTTLAMCVCVAFMFSAVDVSVFARRAEKEAKHAAKLEKRAEKQERQEEKATTGSLRSLISNVPVLGNISLAITDGYNAVRSWASSQSYCGSCGSVQPSGHSCTANRYYDGSYGY